MKVIWFSRHPALQSQVAELKRLFGGDVEIITDPKPFATADDIIRRFRASGAIEMVVVAPLMEVVSVSRAEVVAAGRGYKFIRFRRVKRLVLEFEEI